MVLYAIPLPIFRATGYNRWSMAKKKEHSINEVYEVLTDFVGFVKNQFEKVEDRFDKNDKVFGLVGSQLQQLNKEVKDLKETTGKMDARLKNVEQDVLTIREDVETLGKIAGRDSSTIKSHGRRLINLERSQF